jgi:microsomal dipeptidase-like Zn-dependent dipeptidase
MERAGWKEPCITKIIGSNWLHLFKEVWGA